MNAAEGPARLQRLSETSRLSVSFRFDGVEMRALRGDTVLTGILASATYLRHAEFGPEKRAGFCLMGACQDCWIWQEDGPRLRACSTLLRDGMSLLSQPSRDWSGDGS